MPDSTDTRIRDALVAYTGTEPPLSFTYDEVLAGGRRARRRRRLTVAGAAVAVTAVAAGGVSLALPDRATVETSAGWSTLDAAPYCATASAAPTSPLVEPTTVVNKNGYPIRIPAEPADHAAARISCYLATAVPRLLPKVTFHRAVGAPDGTMPLQAHPVRVFDPARPADTTPPLISAEAVITDDQGAGTIGFGASPAYEKGSDAFRNCPRDRSSDGTGTQCTMRTSPTGEIVTISDTVTASGFTHVEVHVYRADTIITATADNGVDPAKPARKALPLTVAQLIDLAGAPEMTLFP